MRTVMYSIAVCGLFLAIAGGARAQSPQQGFGPGMMMGWGPGPGYDCGWHSGWAEHYGPGYGPGRGMQMGFGIIDQNNNGFIEADEAAAHAEDVFAALDRDDDEALTPEEFLAGPMGYGRGMGPGMGPGMGMGMGRGPRHEQMQARRQARFKELDKNGDGVIDKNEFLDGAAQRFAAVDRDKDGKITVWQFRRQRGM